MNDLLIRYAKAFRKLSQDKWWEKEPPKQPKGSALPLEFWVELVYASKRLGIKSPDDLAKVLLKESGISPSSRNFAAGKDRGPVAQGMSQFIKSTAIGMMKMSEDTWKYFAWMPAIEQLRWTEKYFGSRAEGKDAGGLYLMNFGGFNNPDGSLYAGKAAQQAWIAAHPEDKEKFKNSDYQQKAIEQNSGLVQNDKIMPSAITGRVKGGLPSSIAAKIEEAEKMVEGKDVPGFTEPDPNWTPNTAAVTTPVQQTEPQNNMLQEIESFQSKLWF